MASGARGPRACSQWRGDELYSILTADGGGLRIPSDAASITSIAIRKAAAERAR
jgi:hypothetical protein